MVVCSCSCHCGEDARYAVTTTIEDQGQRVELRIEAEASSGMVRTGILTTRRYEFTLGYPGRPPTVFAIYNDADVPLLTQAEMTATLPRLAIRVSPDRRHFALLISPYARHVHFFHLLPHGQPLHVKAFDDALAAQSLDRVDWARIPAPDQVARDAVLASNADAARQSDFCMLEGPDSSVSNLEQVVRANLDLTVMADLVLDTWPACREPRTFVPEMVTGRTATPAWLERLRRKVGEQLARTDPPAAELVAVVEACKAIGDPELLRQAYRVALARWPRDHEIHYDLFSLEVSSLPPDVRAELVARARAVRRTGNEMQKEWAGSLIREAEAAGTAAP